jgi:hypothetical protein
MERVETLLKKLQDQFAQHAPADQLLLTVQMLQAELLHLRPGNGIHEGAVVVTVSNRHAVPKLHAENIAQALEENRIVEILQVDEADIEAELQEMKRNAESIRQISVQNKPQIVFEMDDDIPTLSHQQKTEPENQQPAKEINEAVATYHTSINEKLKQSKIDLGETLTEAPIRDLRKAIGVNDRFLFINQLFRGDEVAYERSIKTINSFSIFAEAEYWIQRELKVKNGWDMNNEMAGHFFQLIKRRFS